MAHILQEATVGSGPAAERLADLVRGLMHYLSRERDLSRLMVDLWSASNGADSPIDMAVVYGEYRMVITRLLEEAWEEGATLPVDPTEHASVIMGAVDGVVLQSLLELDRAVNPAEMAEPLIRLLVPKAAP